jgi:hypothetical protein
MDLAVWVLAFARTTLEMLSAPRDRHWHMSEKDVDLRALVSIIGADNGLPRQSTRQ